jgi:hypothetical protein
VAAVTRRVRIFDEYVTDNALGSLIDEKGVAMNASALDGGKAGEDAGVGVTENHVGRGAIVPMKCILPDHNFFLDKRA